MQRTLSMEVAGVFVEHLGINMYGGPIPSIVEFVANAWDADATEVRISFPSSVTDSGAKIIIRDNGNGMDFDELQHKFLKIGYAKRKATGERSPVFKRLVMGRKGLGKFAGFGVADLIRIRSIKDNHVITFSMNYSEIRKFDEIKNHPFTLEEDSDTQEKNGVEIQLMNLKLTNRVNIYSFTKGLSRRFAIRSTDMKILINDIEISKDNLEFDSFGRKEESIKLDKYGEITYWYGFLKETIKDPEQRGFAIFSRNRLAQNTPFQFNLTGGINGQVALEYLTGEINADFIDELTDIDLISTDRQSITWNNDYLAEFEQWGKAFIKELCKDWKKRKDDILKKKFRHEYGQYFRRIEHLPGPEKEDVTAALDKIAMLESVTEDAFKTIADGLLQGVERQSVKKVIRAINETSYEGGLEQLVNVIKDWEIISAVSTAEIIQGKIGIIEKLEKLIEARTPEKARAGNTDMQTFLKDHIWLLGREFESFESSEIYHERGVGKFIHDEIDSVEKFKPRASTEGFEKRFDLCVIANNYEVLLIELMRPGLQVDFDHCSRMELYVRKINQALQAQSINAKFTTKNARGLLIADKLGNDSALMGKIQEDRKLYSARSWNDILTEAIGCYREYFNILKSKNPNDPRLQDLGS